MVSNARELFFFLEEEGIIGPPKQKGGVQIIDEEKADIVELRYFGGLSLDEIAIVKNLSKSTIKRSWRVARLWLLDSLESMPQ